MKRHTLYSLIFLLLIFPGFSQSISVKTMMGGIVVKDNEEHDDVLIVEKREEGTRYLLAVKKDFATQVFSLDSVYTSNYKVQLNGLYNLDYNRPIKKLAFNGFLDKGNEIKITEKMMDPATGMMLFTVRNPDLSTIEFKNAVTDRLKQYQFNVIKDESDVFQEKNSNPDMALAGEIIHYSKSSKGTPGYKTTVIVRWTLFDVVKEEIACVFVTGGYSNNQKKMNELSALKLALTDAVGGVITSRALQSYIYGGGGDPGSGTDLQGEEIVISRGPIKVTGDNYIQNAIQSSVTLKTGKGHGSGFIISSSGYILTNFHVISDSMDLEAVFHNGMTLPVRVVCYNKKADVALCKIPGTGYKPLLLDTSYVMDNIGADIVVIGTPKDLGLGQTVTKGIISGMRDAEGEKYIQIDASVNPGNSGGPLITKNGHVIGIITLKRKDSEGIGFALPVGKSLQSMNIRIVSSD